MSQLGLSNSRMTMPFNHVLPCHDVFIDPPMRYGDLIPAPEVKMLVGENFYLQIAEIINPTYFYIQICDSELCSPVDKLMTHIQNVYLLEEKYLHIPRSELCEGLYCACLFMQEWHRALILEVKGNDLTVYFVDYGTVDNVPTTDIRYLIKEFGKIPQFAIAASLVNIVPADSSVWTRNSSVFLLGLCNNKTFTSVFLGTDPQTGVIFIDPLYSDEDPPVTFTEVLIRNKFAIPMISPPYEITNSPYGNRMKRPNRSLKLQEKENLSSIVIPDVTLELMNIEGKPIYVLVVKEERFAALGDIAWNIYGMHNHVFLELLEVKGVSPDVIAKMFRKYHTELFDEIDRQKSKGIPRGWDGHIYDPLHLINVRVIPNLMKMIKIEKI